MKFDYDDVTDSLYIRLVDQIAVGQVSKTYSALPDTVGAIIQFDYDADGKLLAIEIVDASHVLSGGDRALKERR